MDKIHLAGYYFLHPDGSFRVAVPPRFVKTACDLLSDETPDWVKEACGCGCSDCVQMEAMSPEETEGLGELKEMLPRGMMCHFTMTKHVQIGDKSYRITIESNDVDQLRESLGLAPKPLAIIIKRRKPIEEEAPPIDPRILLIAKKLVSSAK